MSKHRNNSRIIEQRGWIHVGTNTGSGTDRTWDNKYVVVVNKVQMDKKRTLDHSLLRFYPT